MRVVGWCPRETSGSRAADPLRPRRAPRVSYPRLRANILGIVIPCTYLQLLIGPVHLEGVLGEVARGIVVGVESHHREGVAWTKKRWKGKIEQEYRSNE